MREMNRQILLKSQLKEELNLVFKTRIRHLQDEIGRRERTPYQDPAVQKVEMAKYNFKLSIAILSKDQIMDLIEKHVHV